MLARCTTFALPCLPPFCVDRTSSFPAHLTSRITAVAAPGSRLAASPSIKQSVFAPWRGHEVVRSLALERLYPATPPSSAGRERDRWPWPNAATSGRGAGQPLAQAGWRRERELTGTETGS